MTSSRAPLLLVIAGLLLGPACSIRLQHDLTEVDANEIYVLLQRNSIDAEKVKDGEGKEASFVISVPRADVATAAELLRAYSLPRPKADGLAIFKQTKGMIPTQTEERAMFIEALGGEVSNALSRIPGVLEVRTIVMIPEANDLAQPENRPQPSASVMIKYMAATEADRSPIPEEEVRTFVAGAVPDLKPERVTVLMKPARFVSGPTPEATSKTILGVKVDAGSAGTFKTIIGVFALLFIVMSAAVAFFVIRRPAGAARPAPRAKSQEG